MLEQHRQAIAGIIRGGCPEGERAVDKNGACPIHVGDRDQRVVELIVIAVADKLVDVRQVIRVATGDIAAALAHLGAGALHILGFVSVRGLVVEMIGVRIVVEVRIVQPDTRPKGESRSEEKGGHDSGAWRRVSGLIRFDRAAAVISAAAE